MTTIKEKATILFVLLALSAICEAIGYFWPSFYFTCLGVIAASMAVVYLIVSIIRREVKDDKNEENVLGCGIPGLFVVFSVLYLFNNDTRYISPDSNVQHLYPSCSTTGNTSMQEVTEMEGYFHSVFADCKVCKERKKAERMKRREEKENEERQEMIDYLQGLIDMLNDGATADDIANILTEDFAIDDEDEVLYRR